MDPNDIKLDNLSKIFEYDSAKDQTRSHILKSDKKILVSLLQNLVNIRFD